MKKTTDLSKIGSYAQTAIATAQYWGDSSRSSKVTVTGSFTFTFYIEPCLVNNYADTIRITEISYTLGTQDMTEGFYIFDETPFCGYPETVTLKVLSALEPGPNGDPEKLLTQQFNVG